MKVLDYRAVNKGAVLASFSLEVPSGLVLCQCVLLQKDGRRWVSGPSRKIGQKFYKTLDFTSPEIAQRFNEAALKALDAHLAAVSQ